MLEPKIIFVAYACDPRNGSEEGIGWRWLYYVGLRYRVHLITADRGNRLAVEAAIDADAILKKNVTFSWLLDIQFPGNRFEKFLLRYYQPYYYKFYNRWLGLAYREAKIILSSDDFNIVHQNTYQSYRDPGDFWRLPIPSVWGPLGGTGIIPWTFLPSLGIVEGAKHFFRNCFNILHKRFNLKMKCAMRGYTRVIAASEGSRNVFYHYRNDVDFIPSILSFDFDRSLGIQKCRLYKTDPVNIVFCCFHSSRKGGAYLIKAFSDVIKLSDVRLHVIGEGSMTDQWKRLADNLGCSHQIIWHGRMDRAAVLRLMSECQALVHPSLSDLYPTVISEALSIGLPVVVSDISGVGDMVNDSCGIVVPSSTPKELISNLAEAMVKIGNDRAYLQSLSLGTKARVAEFDFDTRMQTLSGIYQEVLR